MSSPLKHLLVRLFTPRVWYCQPLVWCFVSLAGVSCNRPTELEEINPELVIHGLIRTSAGAPVAATDVRVQWYRPVAQGQPSNCQPTPWVDAIVRSDDAGHYVYRLDVPQRIEGCFMARTRIGSDSVRVERQGLSFDLSESRRDSLRLDLIQAGSAQVPWTAVRRAR